MTPRLNVLLVENVIDDYELFVLCLEILDLPHEVVRVGTQTELFSVFYHDRKFNLIVIDISEPNWTDGKSLLRKIKTHALLSTVPVVVFTDRKNHEDIDEVYETGAHYYAVKPYFQRNYIETVRSMFQVDWSVVPERPARENFVINLAFA